MEISTALKRTFSHVEIPSGFLPFNVLRFTNQRVLVVISSDSASESSSEPSPPKQRKLTNSRLSSLTPPTSADEDEPLHCSEREALDEPLVRQ